MRQTAGGLVKTSVQLPPAQMDEIDRAAAERGLSRSAFIADLLKRGLADYLHERRILASLGRQREAV